MFGISCMLAYSCPLSSRCGHASMSGCGCVTAVCVLKCVCCSCGQQLRGKGSQPAQHMHMVMVKRCAANRELLLHHASMSCEPGALTPCASIVSSFCRGSGTMRQLPTSQWQQYNRRSCRPQRFYTAASVRFGAMSDQWVTQRSACGC
jgi:hypothetical protein